jgi:hypothetical protein
MVGTATASRAKAASYSTGVLPRMNLQLAKPIYGSDFVLMPTRTGFDPLFEVGGGYQSAAQNPSQLMTIIAWLVQNGNFANNAWLARQPTAATRQTIPKPVATHTAPRNISSKRHRRGVVGNRSQTPALNTSAVGSVSSA